MYVHAECSHKATQVGTHFSTVLNIYAKSYWKQCEGFFVVQCEIQYADRMIFLVQAASDLCCSGGGKSAGRRC